MHDRRPRAMSLKGLVLATVSASALSVAPAHAVVGQAANDSFTFTAKLDIGGQRSCSAALVEKEWLITAASCFAENPAVSLKVPAGPPRLKTRAIVGRTDLTRGGGSELDVVELVPRGDRDLVMARLAKPVTGVNPIDIAFSPEVPGEDVWSSGYGRTKDEWVPDRLHYAKFGVGAVKNYAIDIISKDGVALCQGDTGGPAFRLVGGRAELVGVNSRSWQGGCLGADDAETRKDAVTARTDDIAGWIQSVSSRTLLSRADWRNAAYTASGYFTSSEGENRRNMDLFVVWKDGSASIFQGSDNVDPKTPFSAEHKIAKAGSDWKYARAVAAGNFAGNGTDGLFVRWVDGEVTEYGHLDLNGTHDERTLKEKVQKDPKNFWKNARMVTVGNYSGNGLRDDVLVLWENGSTSLQTDIHSKKLDGHVQLSEAQKSWENAAEISAGDFTGKKTSDLLIRWTDGETSVFPGVDSKGYHGRTKIRDAGSPWKNAHTLTTGSHTRSDNRVNDVLISWDNGNLGMYPDVDEAGTHAAIELVG
ncbi:S1 family peptidase [Streptomyces mobaraensis]|uniref:S1 family peptidase n=1 Tax=Streptomyces mobaraensis TaxID=35621 RepID=UPI0033E05348